MESSERNSRAHLLTSRYPPICYFPDNRPVAEINAFAFSIIRLVDDQVEIASRSVDIVYQEVGGNRVTVAAPLRKQLCIQRC